MPEPNYYYVGNCGPHYFIECRIAYYLLRVVPFILLFVGTCGNILNITILSSTELRQKSTSVYLLALACTELFVLWIGLLPDTTYSISGNRIEDNIPITCRLRNWILLTAGSFASWLLVLLTIDRVVFTKFPVFSRNNINLKKSVILLLIVLSVIALANTHMIYGHRFYYDNAQTAVNATQNTTDLAVPLRCFYTTPKYAKFYLGYWSLFVLVFYNIVPASIIIIGNINTVSAILFRGNRVAAQGQQPATNTEQATRRREAVKLLIVLSISYVMTTTPWCTYFLLRGRQADLTEESLAKWQLATTVVNILLWCNFSFNFFFYFVCGSLFRRGWVQLKGKIARKVNIQNRVQNNPH